MTLDDLVGVTSGDLLIKVTSGDLSGKMPSRKRVRPEVNHFQTHLLRIFMVFHIFGLKYFTSVFSDKTGTRTN